MEEFLPGKMQSNFCLLEHLHTIGSVIGYKGLLAFSNIAYGINDYLEKKGFKKVTEIVGLAHRY